MVALIPVQDMESSMRNTLNEIYFGKTKDIVNDLRFEYEHSFIHASTFSFDRAPPCVLPLILILILYSSVASVKAEKQKEAMQKEIAKALTMRRNK